jgi:hypothetical protein
MFQTPSVSSKQPWVFKVMYKLMFTATEINTYAVFVLKFIFFAKELIIMY